MIPDVVIVGGGLAGLACAMELQKRGISWEILEASDDAGGRVRTDVVDGFRLDRGFQVLLTAYPEAQRVFDYVALDLRKFDPGAMVRTGGRFQALADPLRQPSRALSTAFAGVGTWRDKVNVARLSVSLRGRSTRQLFSGREMTTSEFLSEQFSEEIINQFFRPFFGGVFLETELRTSSRIFEFLFKMFASGDTAVPARHG